MARPQKQTVDFFPHYCNHGKTLYILEQKFGNNGYAFWFKLLERLGKHNGHFLDFSDESELEFFGAETRVSVSEILDMLNLASKLKAIDPILWEKRIVWCQNFVDNLSEVYAKRVVSVPSKPISAPETMVSGGSNPQSRVEEIKLNTPPTPQGGGENIFSSEKYIAKVMADSQPHVRLIGYYFKTKGINFENLETAKSEIKRWVKDAKILSTCSEEKINSVFDFVQKEFPEYWNLSTVVKFLNDPRAHGDN